MVGASARIGNDKNPGFPASVPRDVHTAGRNASRTKPAGFVVFLLKDKDKPALIPVAGH